MSSAHCIRRLVVLVSLATLGCEASPLAEPGGPEMLALATSALTAVTEKQVCSGNHRIGRVEGDAACPEGGPWTRTSLFGANTDLELKGFCHYVYNGNAPTAPPAAVSALPSYKGKPGSVWTDIDCAAVGVAGNTRAIQDVVYASLRDAHRTQLEVPSNVPAGSQDVRVTVIDSKPTSPSAAPGEMRHGLAMGTLIRDLACTGVPGCNVAVDYGLAMNLVAQDQVDNTNGGYAGYVYRLAVQTVQVVDEWVADNDGSKLMLNYSLGIEPAYIDKTSVQLRAAGLALRGALRYARCRGALPIVAAGNETAGPLPKTGPMYPAHWAKQAAPTSCPGPAAPNLSGRPLVYAVSGVTGADQKLRNTRLGGRAELAAPADQVMTQVSVPGGTEMVLSTGSSVAAASVTAVAAAVWANNGALSADAVMDRLQAEGEELGKFADFCYPAGCDKIRRVSMCRALDPTGTTLGCAAIVAYTGTNVQLSSNQLNQVVTKGQLDGDGLDIDGTQVDPLPYEPAVCSEPITVPLGGTTVPVDELLCPSQYMRENRAAPLVEPQPDPDPCGLCVVLRTGVDISINPRVAVAYPTVLTLFDALGNTVHTEDLGSRTTTAGDSLRLGLNANETGHITLNLSSYSFTDATIQWTGVANAPQSVVTSEVHVQ